MQVRTRVWQDGKLLSDLPVGKLEGMRDDPHAHVWVDLEGDPNHHDHKLAEVFGLSHLTMETIEEERERARFTQGRNYFYIITHSLIFDPVTDEAETPKLDILFGSNFVVTVHRTKLEWMDALCESVKRDPKEENLLSRGAPYVLHAILDAQVDSYFPILDEIDGEIDQLENETVGTATKGVQAHIFRLKRALAQMRRVISPQVEVTNAIITRTGEVIPTDAEPYFADVHDHLIRAFEVIDSYRDLMSGLLDVYLSTVSNRLNEVMKQLAIIATLFLPITFVTGVFGQNFGHSPQVEHDSGLNFWLVLAFLALISAMQLYYFRRRGWL
jgi:magnesium transporter